MAKIKSYDASLHCQFPRQRITLNCNNYDLKRLPYFETSGTSNENMQIFKGTFFPTGGMNSKRGFHSGGWFQYGPGYIRKFIYPWGASWIKAILNEWEGKISLFTYPVVERWDIIEGNKRQEERESKETFDKFFTSYFKYWFQVQQSAAIGTGLWKHKGMQKFKRFVLTHNWNPSTNQFEEDDAIPQYYTLPKTCSVIVKRGEIPPVHKWLKSEHAFVPESEGGVAIWTENDIRDDLKGLSEEDVAIRKRWAAEPKANS